tara:strand:- start:1225 stop:2109 length:885 start_codon:yes stop_codon:yes gene_type:complete
MFTSYLLKVGLIILNLIALAPPKIGIKIGKFLGRVLYLISKKRKYVTKTNLRTCFPKINEEALNELVKQCFQETGIGIVETGWAWYRKVNFFERRIKISGLEILNSSNNRGILLTCAHHSMVDVVSPILFSLFGPFVISYRPNGNLLLDKEIKKGRAKYADLVNVRSLRILIKKLKTGNLVWFGPDQDMGPKGSVFVPFFNHPTCTVTTPSRLVEITGAKPVHLQIKRVEDTYEVNFENYPSDYPTGNVAKDAIILNQKIENTIRKIPSQYLWMHKRFKTEPNGNRDRLYQNLS